MESPASFSPELLTQIPAIKGNIFKNLKIRTKIILPIILTAVIVLLTATLYSYFFNLKTIETAVSAHLQTTITSRAHHVETVLEMYEQRAGLLSSKTWLRKHLKSYYETNDGEYKVKVEENLANVQKENPKFLHISIINPEGKIVISTIKDSVGKDISNKDFFINGKKDYTISDFHEPEPDGSRLHIAGPLIQDGEFLGVINYAGLGETGEVYLINKEGYMITPSRFRKDTFLKTKVDTLQANLCIGEHVLDKLETEMKEIPKTYPDYIGKKVLGIHHFIPQMNWCLLAEINESEALASTKNLLIFSTIRALIVLSIFFIVAYLLARTISRPIIALREGAEIIEKGNLNHKVSTQSQDEIGELSRAFDKMTTAIKQSRTNVDRKVKEQTQQIIEQQKTTERAMQDLEEQNKAMTGRELKMLELKKEINKLKGRTSNG
jgi:HAMP domain-containing protein